HCRAGRARSLAGCGDRTRCRTRSLEADAGRPGSGTRLMRVLEPWLAEPLGELVRESSARLALVMTSSGQVVGQHGFTRSLDVMAAAALGAGILATTGELARLVGSDADFGAVVHQGAQQGVWLAGFDTPRGRWVALVV